MKPWITNVAMQSSNLKSLALPFIGIEVIAKKLNVSPKTKLISSWFMEHLFYSITLIKMQFAMQLLLNTNMQIKHIAFEVGYDNHSKFSAAFRKNTKTFRYPT
jgi:AraC-like DNA-binding protein